MPHASLWPKTEHHFIKDGSSNRFEISWPRAGTDKIRLNVAIIPQKTCYLTRLLPVCQYALNKSLFSPLFRSFTWLNFSAILNMVIQTADRQTCAIVYFIGNCQLNNGMQVNEGQIVNCVQWRAEGLRGFILVPDQRTLLIKMENLIS